MAGEQVMPGKGRIGEQLGEQLKRTTWELLGNNFQYFGSPPLSKGRNIWSPPAKIGDSSILKLLLTFNFW